MRRLNKANQERCAHDTTLTVASAGLDRQICESCGRVSMQFRYGLTGMIDRGRFARPADGSPDSPATSPDSLAKNFSGADG